MDTEFLMLQVDDDFQAKMRVVKHGAPRRLVRPTLPRSSRAPSFAVERLRQRSLLVESLDRLRREQARSAPLSRRDGEAE